MTAEQLAAIKRAWGRCLIQLAQVNIKINERPDIQYLYEEKKILEENAQALEDLINENGGRTEK